MKRLLRAIRPALLAACGFVYLVFIFQFAQYHFRVHRLRAILEDVQTLEVSRSTYVDAAAIADRHRAYPLPKASCTPTDCEWSMQSYNMPFMDITTWACNKRLSTCDFLDSLSDARTLNSLGMRRSFAWAGFEVHQGVVKSVGEGISVEGASHKWLENRWEFLPESPEPWMSNWQKELYRYTDDGKRNTRGRSSHFHAGAHLGEFIEWLITPSTPEDLRREAYSFNWSCWNGLKSCFERGDIVRGTRWAST